MRVATLPPEYNLRLGMATTVVDRVRLLHGHTSRYEKLAAQYNRKIVARTYPQERLIRRFARRVYERLRR